VADLTETVLDDALKSASISPEYRLLIKVARSQDAMLSDITEIKNDIKGVQDRLSIGDVTINALKGTVGSLSCIRGIPCDEKKETKILRSPIMWGTVLGGIIIGLYETFKNWLLTKGIAK
jgi:hypothetical protein